ncbi:hypothetical protein [cf. Phormidesmis sp. LEGE 11477]|uniref:hypothetical protein n=1 Tax=cf. Phormidesmis sp. LEGE 11477 TaxID=1828680 RepID=UPI0018816968|nr:hypothetical protein [cf. Phormidesmis sp. LEGE 11477]MBE9064868.1 hypothetical protein [cf. Phormidesmis sp. LEGE 11477]
MASSTVLAVIAGNCLLAALVMLMIKKVWRWRCELTRLTAWLRSVGGESGAGHSADNAANAVAIASQQMGLALMMRRSHIAETRLRLARLKLISHQINQLLGLIRLLIVIGQRHRRKSQPSRPSSAK